MNKYLWCYSIWMALTTAIYALIYLMTPLAGQGVMWMTFVALPIFFTAGAKTEEIPNYISCIIVGIIWGMINLGFTNFLLEHGLSVSFANAINLLILTIPCVGIHLTILGKTWFNKVPMIFGGLAMTFSQGGTKLISIAITLICGVLLAYIYRIGGDYLAKKMLK